MSDDEHHNQSAARRAVWRRSNRPERSTHSFSERTPLANVLLATLQRVAVPTRTRG